MPNYHTLFDIQGQTAVITGGSGELGKAMVRGLALAGVRVAIVGLHSETTTKVAETIRAEGGESIGIACDVVDRAALESALEQVTKALALLIYWSTARAAINHWQLPLPNVPFSTWICRLSKPSLT